jgi:hypothetical protein
MIHLSSSAKDINRFYPTNSITSSSERYRDRTHTKKKDTQQLLNQLLCVCMIIDEQEKECPSPFLILVPSQPVELPPAKGQHNELIKRE